MGCNNGKATSQYNTAVNRRPIMWMNLFFIKGISIQCQGFLLEVGFSISCLILNQFDLKVLSI